jgi:hypothetical protein
MPKSSRRTREKQLVSLSTHSGRQTKGIVGPLVGEEWPELGPKSVSWTDTNGGSFHFRSTTDGKKVSRSLALRLNVKTRFLSMVVLAAIALYAMAQHDTGLLKAIVVTVASYGSGSASKPPP